MQPRSTVAAPVADVRALDPDPRGWSGTWVPAAVGAPVRPDPPAWLAGVVRECLAGPVRTVPPEWSRDPMWQWRPGGPVRDERSLLEDVVGASPGEVSAWWRGEGLPDAAAGGRLLALCGVDRHALAEALGAGGLGPLLRSGRELRRWSPAELARRVGRGSSGADVEAWEAERAFPTARSVRTVAGLFRFDPAEVERCWLASRVAGWPGAAGYADPVPTPAGPAGRVLRALVGPDRAAEPPGPPLEVDADATWADLLWPVLAVAGVGDGDPRQWWRVTVPVTGQVDRWREGLGDRVLVCAAEVEQVWAGVADVEGPPLDVPTIAVTERGVRIGAASGTRVAHLPGPGAQAVVTFDYGRRWQVQVRIEEPPDESPRPPRVYPLPARLGGAGRVRSVGHRVPLPAHW